MNSKTDERVLGILDAVLTKSGEEKITIAADTTLQELRDRGGLDSLDIIETIMGMEDEFGIDIPDDVVDGWDTVGDIQRSVRATAP